MSFLADDTSSGLGESRKEFLKEYIKVWEKIRDLVGKIHKDKNKVIK